MMVLPLCFTCRHFERGQQPGVYRCAAFPTGIPQPILMMDVDHRKPYDGDHGVQYERDETIARDAATSDPLAGFDF